MQGTSKELQEVALKGIMSDPYLLSKCSGVITENYFENVSYKLIYKCVKKFYNKYSVIPSQEELLLLINDNHREEYGSIDDIHTDIDKLYSMDLSNEDFVYEKVIEFIRRNKIEGAINNIAEYVTSGNIDLDKVAVELRDGLSINLSRSTTLNLSDISKIKEVKEDALGSSENPVIIKFFIDPVNWCMQYKGLIPGTITMIVAPPGRGKTTTSINQGLSTAQQGFTVLHIFLGDMSRFDGLLRYLSCLSGVPTSKLVELSIDDLTKFVKKWNMTGILGKITVASYAADEVTPDQLIEDIKVLQKNSKTHYDLIIIDYDENFRKETDSMYESGGNVYNRIALFAVLNKSVMIILAQPKPQYWDKEVIPLEAAAESSKKQKIIDLMLTIGSPSKDSSVGTLNIAKNRRGEDCKVVRLKKDGATARISAISDEDYLKIKNKEKFKDNSGDNNGS